MASKTNRNLLFALVGQVVVPPLAEQPSALCLRSFPLNKRRRRVSSLLGGWPATAHRVLPALGHFLTNLDILLSDHLNFTFKEVRKTVEKKEARYYP